MADKTSKTGVWVDTETGKVVSKSPASGIQLVVPGGEIDGFAQARIDAYGADPDAPAVSAAESLGYETASAPAEVEKAADTVKAEAKKAPAKRAK